MRFNEFCKELHGRLGKDAVSQAQTARIATHMIALISDVVMDEGRLALPGLGVFKLVKSPERTLNNPKYQGTVPEHLRVRFRPASQLKREAREIPV